MGADSGKNKFAIGIWRIGKLRRTAQITGDDAGVGLEKQKARAFKKLHQRSCSRKSAFGKKNQFAAALKEFRHAFDSERGIDFYGKRKPVYHDESMDETGLRRLL